jgi:thioesterase domain-containing protein
VPGFERRPPLPDLIRLVVEEISALRLIEVPRHLWGKMRLRARMRRALWKLADRFGLVAKLLPHSVRTNFDAAHLRASREFKPQAYSGKISLFKVTSRRRPETSDPGLGWSSLAKGGVEIYETVGKHQNMIQEPFVGPLAELLNAAIEKAVERAEVRP